MPRAGRWLRRNAQRPHSKQRPKGVPQRAALRQSENPVLPFVAHPRAWTGLARSTERMVSIGSGCGGVKWGLVSPLRKQACRAKLGWVFCGGSWSKACHKPDLRGPRFWPVLRPCWRGLRPAVAPVPMPVHQTRPILQAQPASQRVRPWRMLPNLARPPLPNLRPPSRPLHRAWPLMAMACGGSFNPAAVRVRLRSAARKPA